MRNVSDESHRQKSHILCSVTFIRKSCRLWVDVEKHGGAWQATGDSILRRMRVACWITKAADTHPHPHTQYVISVAFPRSQWLRERSSILRYTNIACLVPIFVFFWTKDTQDDGAASRCGACGRLFSEAENTCVRGVWKLSRVSLGKLYVRKKEGTARSHWMSTSADRCVSACYHISSAGLHNVPD